MTCKFENYILQEIYPTVLSWHTKKLTVTSIGASGDELVMVGALLTVDVIGT